MKIEEAAIGFTRNILTKDYYYDVTGVEIAEGVLKGNFRDSGRTYKLVIPLSNVVYIKIVK